MMFDSIKAFKVRLRLWDDQIHVHNLVHLPKKKSLETIFRVLKIFQEHFSVMRTTLRTIPRLENYVNETYFYASTLNAETGNAPEKSLQMGLINLRYDTSMNQTIY
jgi:hypothetical protein